MEKQGDKAVTLQTLFVSVAQGHAFLLQILVQEYWFHYQQLCVVVFGWAFVVFMRISNKSCLLVLMVIALRWCLVCVDAEIVIITVMLRNYQFCFSPGTWKMFW